MLSPATLSIFHHLFASVAEEMGITLERAAYSPNIKERRDFSCALFLADGRMLAQAAHIPVHLGAMPASVQAAITHTSPFTPGDVTILNDPYMGGNHLPDITLVSPVFLPHHPTPTFFIASRAHHADVGGISPGSMPLSTELFQEGIIIPPLKLINAGTPNQALWQLILRNVRTPQERNGDLAAQLAAHTTGNQRLLQILHRYGAPQTLHHAHALLHHTETLTRAAIRQIPNGTYTFRDHLDNDGQTPHPIPLVVTLTITTDHLHADFTGTSPAVPGNLNAVPAIVLSALTYCLRCIALALTHTDLPMNAGAFAPITLTIPPGSLLDPHPPHAVAAGNVETSQRLTDLIFGAFAQALPHLIPAASQGTMNNLTFGGHHNHQPFAYYETIAGGCGANAHQAGASALHTHMTNTLNTPIEALEYNYPLQITTYALRPNSGGHGIHHGGDGLIRTFHFHQPVTLTLTTDRRTIPPYGLHNGQPATPGQNQLIQADGTITPLPGKITLTLQAGDTLQIATPGGGGWGSPQNNP